MRIGEIAARAGVPAKTIRFWEDQRLLPPPERTASGYRDYQPAVLERLAFIRHAQAAGLTLEAIRQVMQVRDGGQSPCVHSPRLSPGGWPRCWPGWPSFRPPATS